MGQVGASKTFSMGLEPYPRHFENRKSGEPRESHKFYEVLWSRGLKEVSILKLKSEIKVDDWIGSFQLKSKFEDWL